MGVPLIPDRVGARSRLAGWSGRHSGATDRPHPDIIAVGASLPLAALAVAVAVGAVPLAGAAAIGLLVPAAVVDIQQRRLPDAWVAAATALLVAVLSVGAAIGQPLDVWQVLAAALAMALPVLVLHLVSPASMGFGDVKASAVLGAAVGTIDWRLGAVALCIAALTGATAGLFIGRRSIAFGPFLVFGAWFALLASGPIISSVFSGSTP